MISRRRLLEIHAALTALAEHATGVKMAYAIARNLGTLRAEVEAVQRASQPSKEYLDYEQARIRACAALAMRDEQGQGQPLIVDGQYVLGDNQAELDAQVSALREKHAAAIANRERQLAELNELLEAKMEHHLRPISLEQLEAAVRPDAPSLATILEPLLEIVIV